MVQTQDMFDLPLVLGEGHWRYIFGIHIFIYFFVMDLNKPITICLLQGNSLSLFGTRFVDGSRCTVIIMQGGLSKFLK